MVVTGGSLQDVVLRSSNPTDLPAERVQSVRNRRRPGVTPTTILGREGPSNPDPARERRSRTGSRPGVWYNSALECVRCSRFSPRLASDIRL